MKKQNILVMIGVVGSALLLSGDGFATIQPHITIKAKDDICSTTTHYSAEQYTAPSYFVDKNDGYCLNRDQTVICRCGGTNGEQTGVARVCSGGTWYNTPFEGKTWCTK